MAERLNKLDTERVLRRIKLSQLVSRLQNNALGLLKSPNDRKKEVQMTDSQIRSATFLVERAMAKAVAPQDINLQGNLTVEVVRFADKSSSK